MDFQYLVQKLVDIHEAFQENTKKAINQSLTIRNWSVGYYIFEFEQEGKDRAKYGKKLLKEISKKLKNNKIVATSTTNLKLYRRFYLTYPVVGNYITEKIDAQLIKVQGRVIEKDEFIKGLSPKLLFQSLSFSHFVELIKVDKPIKRLFYEIECIKGNSFTTVS